MCNHSVGKLTCCGFPKVTVSGLFLELLEKEGKTSVCHQHLSKNQGTCKEGRRLLLKLFFSTLPKVCSCMYSVVVINVRSNVLCS